jgi:hypothetical protein
MCLIDAAQAYDDFDEFEGRKHDKLKKNVKRCLYNWAEISESNRPYRSWSLVVSSSVAADDGPGNRNSWIPTAEQFEHAADLIRKLRHGGEFADVDSSVLTEIVSIVKQDIRRAKTAAPLKRAYAELTIEYYKSPRNSHKIGSQHQIKKAFADSALKNWEDFRYRLAGSKIEREIAKLGKLA